MSLHWGKACSGCGAVFRKAKMKRTTRTQPVRDGLEFDIHYWCKHCAPPWDYVENSKFFRNNVPCFLNGAINMEKA